MTRWQIVALLALSLWSSATWLTADILPSQMMPIAAQGFRLLLLGGLSLPVLLPRPAIRSRIFERSYVPAGVASLGLIGLPFLLLSATQGRIASTDGVLVFAMVPVGVALWSGWSSDDADGTTGVTLVPYCLLGVTGILILLPVRMTEGVSGLLGLGLLLGAMVLTTACLIWSARLLHGLSLLGAVPIVCLANGILLLLAAVFLERQGWSFQVLQIEAVRCLLVDLPEMLLLLWLLKTVSPWRLSARYVIAPLFTVLEGLWLVRPRFEVRTAVGIALLMASAVFIIFGKPSRDQTRLGLT